MKIAIASQPYSAVRRRSLRLTVGQNKKSVTEHTRRCQKFWIYEINEQEITKKSLLELPKEQSLHNSSPDESHPLNGVQVLISGGMGRGLVRRLASYGIEGIITQETDREKALAAYLDGTLVREEPEAHEHGHDVDSEHDHEHCHH